MSLSTSERGRLGGLAAAANMTPEQRTCRARRGHLASAVRVVTSRWEDLSPDQRREIAAIVAEAGQA